MEKEAVNTYSPLTLAYLGDAVFELTIRERLVRQGNARPHILDRCASALACAAAQSQMAELLLPYLTAEETAIYHHGRNAHPLTRAKHQSLADYHRATGLEALIGYLYLREDKERWQELIDRGIKLLEENPDRKSDKK